MVLLFVCVFGLCLYLSFCLCLWFLFVFMFLCVCVFCCIFFWFFVSVFVCFCLFTYLFAACLLHFENLFFPVQCAVLSLKKSGWFKFWYIKGIVRIVQYVCKVDKFVFVKINLRRTPRIFFYLTVWFYHAKENIWSEYLIRENSTSALNEIWNCRRGGSQNFYLKSSYISKDTFLGEANSNSLLILSHHPPLSLNGGTERGVSKRGVKWKILNSQALYITERFWDDKFKFAIGFEQRPSPKLKEGAQKRVEVKNFQFKIRVTGIYIK